MSTARERTMKIWGKKSALDGPILRFTINGQVIDVDYRTITIRENFTSKQAAIEAGFPPSDPQIANARAGWVVGRRTHPDLTFDEVLDAMTIGDLMDFNEATSAQDDDSPEA